MANRNIKTRDFEREYLVANGYRYSRQTGSHRIWVKAGCRSITTTCHLMNEMVVRRLIKENKL